MCDGIVIPSSLWSNTLLHWDGDKTLKAAYSLVYVLQKLSV